MQELYVVGARSSCVSRRRRPTARRVFSRPGRSVDGSVDPESRAAQAGSGQVIPWTSAAAGTAARTHNGVDLVGQNGCRLPLPDWGHLGEGAAKGRGGVLLCAVGESGLGSLTRTRLL